MKSKSKKNGKKGKKKNSDCGKVAVIAVADVSEDESASNVGSDEFEVVEHTNEEPVEKVLQEEPDFEELRCAHKLLVDAQGRSERMAKLVGVVVEELAAINKVVEKASGTFMDFMEKMITMKKELQEQKKQLQEQQQQIQQQQEQEDQEQQQQEQQKQKHEQEHEQEHPKQSKQPDSSPQQEQQPQPVIKSEIEQEQQPAIKVEVEQDQQTCPETVQAVTKFAARKSRAKGMVTIKMTDIDMVATGADIVQAVEERIGVTIITPSLQRHRNGWLSSVFSMPREQGYELVSMGKLMVNGINSKLKIVDPLSKELQRCSRCLERGHIARKCDGVDRSNLCLQCAQPGHSSATCTEIPKCILCGNEHRMGARTCPYSTSSS